jgi:3-oxoacid CoA-transferase subunit A
MYSKKISNPADIIKYYVRNECTIMSGGFGLCGIPENSINFISKLDVKNLKVISNNIGNSGRGLVKLLKKNMISTAFCSYVGGNPDLEEKILNKTIDIVLIPQGTFIERIRAAGVGIRAFYTPTGHGTEVALGKDQKDFDRPCILEHALSADVAIIKAEIGDEYGNLYFKETAQNFSPIMAMAARTTIVEVEKIVPIGDLSPDLIQLPGIFVQHIYQGNKYENVVEHLRVQE